MNRLAAYLEAHVGAKELAIPDCRLAAWQFMQMCQASLFLPFIFQAAPPPSAEHIAQVVDSATRMFLAAYRTDPDERSSKSPGPQNSGGGMFVSVWNLVFVPNIAQRCAESSAYPFAR